MTGPRDNSHSWAEGNFRAVFLEHYDRIVGVLFRLVGDRSRAEEVANDVFWRLYREPALQKEGNVGGWLYRTASNLGIDTIRAASRRKQYEEAAGREGQHVSEGTGPLDRLVREEECRRVRAVLASMKPHQAQVLILRASGLTYKELAESLDVKAISVGTMLNRAEDEFRKRYTELHGHEEEL